MQEPLLPRPRGRHRWPTAAVAVLALLLVAPAQGNADGEARCDEAAAVAATDPVARHRLGVCFLLGEGRLMDHRQALALFASAASDGVQAAAFSHAAALLYKVRDEARFSQAVAQLQRLASDGYRPAHFALAVAYVAALGVEEDPARGVEEFATAAREAGDEVAAWVLAVVYRYGLLGQGQDETLAWQYVALYLDNLRRQFPQLVFNAQRLRESARTLHHDRLLRRHVFTDAQLELFHALAEEVAQRDDLAALRRNWSR